VEIRHCPGGRPTDDAAGWGRLYVNGGARIIGAGKRRCLRVWQTTFGLKPARSKGATPNLAEPSTSASGSRREGAASRRHHRVDTLIRGTSEFGGMVPSIVPNLFDRSAQIAAFFN